MPTNNGSGTFLGEAGTNKILELFIEELDKKQDVMDEVSAERVQEIWDEEMGSSESEPEVTE